MQVARRPTSKRATIQRLADCTGEGTAQRFLESSPNQHWFALLGRDQLCGKIILKQHKTLNIMYLYLAKKKNLFSNHYFLKKTFAMAYIFYHMLNLSQENIILKVYRTFP